MKLFTFMRLGLWSSVLVVGAIIIGGGTQRIRSLLHRFDDSPAKVTDNRAVILKSIQNASELTTSIFVMEVVVPTEQNETIAGFTVGTTKLLYLAHGEVRAGVDLKTLSKNSFTTDGDRLVLKLPAPKILDSKIDVKLSKVYDYNKGWLGPDTAPQLQELAEKKALERIEEAACKGGILTKAGEQAVVVVGQLAKASGQEITVDMAVSSGCAN